MASRALAFIEAASSHGTPGGHCDGRGTLAATFRCGTFGFGEYVCHVTRCGSQRSVQRLCVLIVREQRSLQR